MNIYFKEMLLVLFYYVMPAVSTSLIYMINHHNKYTIHTVIRHECISNRQNVNTS